MPSLPLTRRNIVLGPLCLLGGSALAEEPYPAKPISLIVSLQAGSGSDVASRLVAEHMAATKNT